LYDARGVSGWSAVWLVVVGKRLALGFWAIYTIKLVEVGRVEKSSATVALNIRNINHNTYTVLIAGLIKLELTIY
jgi:hypothetical protein